jgi:hypothetical protein
MFNESHQRAHLYTAAIKNPPGVGTPDLSGSSLGKHAAAD